MGVETGNSFVLNYGLNPCTNFNFMLRVEGLWDCPCRAVHVFQKENEYELIQEGGLNDYVHMRRKPISKPFTFQVERYVGVDAFVDPLANGTDLVLPLILLVNRYHMKASYAYPIRTYCFTGCTVMGKEYGELNAEKSGLLVETTTIAYREMFAVDMGYQGYNADPWHFKGGNTDNKDKSAEEISRSTISAENFKGIGQVATKDNHGIIEPRKSTMEKNAKKWSINKPTENVQAKSPEKQVTKEDMKARAVKWDINKPKVIKRGVQPDEQHGKKYLEAKAVKWNIQKPAENRSAKLAKGQKTKKQMLEMASIWKITSPTQNKRAKSPDNQKSRKELEKKAVKYLFASGKKNVRAVQVPGARKKAAMKLKAIRWNIMTPAVKTSAVSPENQLEQSQMESKAIKWKFQKTVSGETKSPKGQLNKKQMEGKATGWEFQKTASGETKSPKGQLSKKQMEGKATEWKFQKTVGEKTKSPKNQLSKEQMEKNKSKWPPKKNAVQVTSFLQKK